MEHAFVFSFHILSVFWVSFSGRYNPLCFFPPPAPGSINPSNKLSESNQTDTIYTCIQSLSIAALDPHNPSSPSTHFFQPPTSPPAFFLAFQTSNSVLVGRGRRRAHEKGTPRRVHAHRPKVLLRALRVDRGVGEEHQDGGVLLAVLVDAQPRPARRLDPDLDVLAACWIGRGGVE